MENDISFNIITHPACFVLTFKKGYVLSLGNENKNHVLFCFALDLHYLLSYGKKISGASAMKIKTTFYFALRSTCITFILRKEDKRRLGNENKNHVLFCIALDLHYLCNKQA
ncbi:MAG: hypothetical protein IJ421_01805 [Prevotella sp.]|nr:hypothetical protein [Prevotella sp.]